MNYPNQHSQESNEKDTVGATPGKLVLIGVLAIVLIASAVINLGGGDAPPSTASSKRKPKLPVRNRSSTKTRNTSSPQGKAAKPKRLAKDIAWPQFSPVEAAAFDPFAKPNFLLPPPPVPEPEPEPEPVDPGPTPEEARQIADTQALQSMQRVVVSLSDLGITMIVSSREGAVAQIGNRELRVGDAIEGLVVTRIDMDGIELAMPTPSNGASSAD